MPMEFAATTVAFGLVDDGTAPPYLHVTLAGPGGAYLSLNRDQPDADDEDWGLYVEVNGPATSGYECVDVCDLSAARLRVVMADPLGPAGEVDRVEVTFDAIGPPTAALVGCLRAIFAGRERHLRLTGRLPGA